MSYLPRFKKGHKEYWVRLRIYPKGAWDKYGEGISPVHLPSKMLQAKDMQDLHQMIVELLPKKLQEKVEEVGVPVYQRRCNGFRWELWGAGGDRDIIGYYHVTLIEREAGERKYRTSRFAAVPPARRRRLREKVKK